MKHKLSTTLGLIIFVMIALVTTTVDAQTVAPGPYYAPPSWDQTLPSSTRFIVLSNMNSAAVLDRETGLVWEKSPSASTFDWFNAQSHCNGLVTANRLGWRLPTFQELASLVDKSVPFPPGPALPSGHPFTNVQTLTEYWSGTTFALNTLSAWTMNFSSPSTNVMPKSNPSIHLPVWCVRGGQGVDPQ